VYDFDHYRYWLGPCVSVGNVYPRMYSQAFYEGALSLTDEGTSDDSNKDRGTNKHSDKKNLVNLVRCAWAGSQKFGALVWSGDIASSWQSLRHQLSAGLNMAVAGIAYWTTDIGGFHGGDPEDPAFRELFVRWFQWGAFLPVMRLHGDRHPVQPPLADNGGGKCPSGAANEVWSYGDEVYRIAERYLRLRESMRDYVRGVMREASEEGKPVIRPLFLEFPRDKAAWEVDDEYMFGGKYLVAPVLEHGARKRSVYFPKGARWKALEGEEMYEGGGTHEVDAPLEWMPVFIQQ
jgi:alpha-D-xyloside xylohydrolase